MTESCVVMYQEDEYRGQPNCPNCGRFLKWNGWELGFSCKCEGIFCIFGSGDPDVDDVEYAIRVCKIPDLEEVPV